MTTPAAAALILECFFNPPTDGSVPADSVQRARAPVSAEIAESLIARQPPENSGRFEGEPSGIREWLIASTRDPTVTSFKALRVSLSTNLALPSPYAARLGMVHVSADHRSSRFEQQMTGWCKLNPVDRTSQ